MLTGATTSVAVHRPAVRLSAGVRTVLARRFKSECARRANNASAEEVWLASAMFGLGGAAASAVYGDVWVWAATTVACTLYPAASCLVCAWVIDAKEWVDGVIKEAEGC